MMIASHDIAHDIANKANDWAGGAISEELVQDRDVVTAARLEGLLMAACTAPVNGGLHGSIELPSAAPAPLTHPTDVVASSSPVRESERWADDPSHSR